MRALGLAGDVLERRRAGLLHGAHGHTPATAILDGRLVADDAIEAAIAAHHIARREIGGAGLIGLALDLLRLGLALRLHLLPATLAGALGLGNLLAIVERIECALHVVGRLYGLLVLLDPRQRLLAVQILAISIHETSALEVAAFGVRELVRHLEVLAVAAADIHGAVAAQVRRRHTLRGQGLALRRVALAIRVSHGHDCRSGRRGWRGQARIQRLLESTTLQAGFELGHRHFGNRADLPTLHVAGLVSAHAGGLVHEPEKGLRFVVGAVRVHLVDDPHGRRAIGGWPHEHVHMVAVRGQAPLGVTVMRPHGVFPLDAIRRDAFALAALRVLHRDVHALRLLAREVAHLVVARLFLRLRGLGEVVGRAGGGLVRRGVDRGLRSGRRCRLSGIGIADRRDQRLAGARLKVIPGLGR
ncbi:hypothetical protein D3C85_866150 [compost metagenome]